MSKILYIFLLLPLLALGGCGDANEDAIDSPHPVGAAWLNPANAGFHGDAADTSCAQCHDSGGAIVSCDSCHFGPTGSKVPAGVTNWTHGTIPHDDLKAYEATCNKCHDLLRGYNDGPNSCHDCHGSSANHVLGEPWLNPANADFHGAAAEQSGANCTQCHGVDYLGGSSGVSCSKCHFGPTGEKVPADVTNWNHKDFPHGDLKAYGATCNACHDLMRIYGRTIDSKSATCSTCHGGSAVGHATGEPWLNPANNGFHGDAAVQSGANCTQCHGADYLGGSSGVSCSKCHFGPTGSKVPTGVTNWNHGKTDHWDQKIYGATCNKCHDLMRAYGKDIKSKSATCSTCHN